ncbi:hypothetical protein [Tindallia californiensis]|uniref:Flagellar motility protein MotE, a chaperone for MotC folding n=1 Tax=Tindallia californiensis TaxID=159292 RepID=A0A1H3NS82_9FIRM|nr:hypothetical protein [Tindallia californiensis]SDY91648.1 hypothetical protein SAMN05192546_105258 [Tindallia californiensis]
MAEEIEVTQDKSSSYKIIIIIALFILLIPILTVAILYNTNESFKDTTNNVFVHIPGPVGNYFRSIPSPDEQDELKLEIAKYYIGMDEDRIVDKLLILKGEDEDLYNELRHIMSRENPRKMTNVNERLQRAFLQDGSLQRILEEIEQDQEVFAIETANYITSLSLPAGVKEMERLYSAGEIGSKELGDIFRQFSEAKAADYLRYIDDNIAQQVRVQIPSNFRSAIDRNIENQLAREAQLINKASLYESKSVNDTLPLIGSDQHHSIQELAFIYHHFPTDRGGRILSEVNDMDFIQDLYDEMLLLEELIAARDGKTRHLGEAVTFYRNYQQKVKDMVDVYQRMGMDELAPLIERMLVSNTIIEQHIFSPEEQIVKTEENLVLDVLRGMRTADISELMGELSTPRAALLSQKIYRE